MVKPVWHQKLLSWHLVLHLFPPEKHTYQTVKKSIVHCDKLINKVNVSIQQLSYNQSSIKIEDSHVKGTLCSLKRKESLDTGLSVNLR